LATLFRHCIAVLRPRNPPHHHALNNNPPQQKQGCHATIASPTKAQGSKRFSGSGSLPLRDSLPKLFMRKAFALGKALTRTLKNPLKLRRMSQEQALQIFVIQRNQEQGDSVTVLCNDDRALKRYLF
jgi:hypothetical protein